MGTEQEDIEIFEIISEDDLTYLKIMEQEFTNGVDDLLKRLNLSHLRIQPIKEAT